MEDKITKIEQSIKNILNKSARIYFFVQDTKGNAKASIKYIYDMALTLKNDNYNVIILHEKPDYFGVTNWLGNKYDGIQHQSVEGQNLQIAPEDIMIIPEIFGYVMSQLTNLPCTKIVLSQSYDYILFLDADVTFTNKQAIKMALDKMRKGDYEMLSTTPVYKGEFDAARKIQSKYDRNIRNGNSGI